MAGEVCAARNAAVGKVTASKSAIVKIADGRESGERLSAGLSMAAILLSSVDERAIGVADTHVARGWRHVRAISNKCSAYSRAGIRAPSTRSSQACSLSRRRRAQAIQISGLNQNIVRTASAAIWMNQS